MPSPPTGGDATPATARGHTYDCPGCGAELAFDADVGALVCAHCDGTVAIERVPLSLPIVEHDLETGLIGERDRKAGPGDPLPGGPLQKSPDTPSRTTACDSCGAVVNFEASFTATECDFCGSSQVLPVEARRQVIHPESLVPFRIARTGATKIFRDWIGGLWFRPSDLKRRAEIGDMRGVYLPYWTFDARVESRWRGLAGHYYFVQETRQEMRGTSMKSRTARVRKVRWEPAAGMRTDRYDDLLVAASRGVPTELLARLRGFDTTALEPYQPQYLAGWKAEEYAVRLNDAWRLAIARIEAGQRGRCRADVPGDTVADLAVDNRISDTRFKHILLPVWIAAYRYNGKLYQLLVSGQSGDVVGRAPLSAGKIALVVLAAAAALALLITLGGR